MNKIKCYDLAKMVLDEASETIASGLLRDACLERRISESCAMFDELVEKYGACEFHTEVNTETLEITLSIDFPDTAEIELPNRPVTALGDRFAFGNRVNDDGVKVFHFDVVFGRIWFDLSQKHEACEGSGK